MKRKRREVCLILHVFIAFERCFIQGITERLSCFFLPRASSPTIPLFTSCEQMPGGFPGSAETEI